MKINTTRKFELTETDSTIKQGPQDKTRGAMVGLHSSNTAKLLIGGLLISSLSSGVGAQTVDHSSAVPHSNNAIGDGSPANSLSVNPQSDPNVRTTNRSATAGKQGVSFIASTVAGAVIAGPIGMIVGAVSGAYIGEKIKQADSLEQNAMSLSQSEATVFDLQQQLQHAKQQMAQYQHTHDASNEADNNAVVWQQLEFQVLFSTGSDQLNAHGERRLQDLADFLNHNPELKLQLDGHTDPRGTDEYNNVLSNYRAANVRQILIEQGVDADRIHHRGHGSRFAQAQSAPDYPSDRRVAISIFQADTKQLASN